MLMRKVDHVQEEKFASEAHVCSWVTIRMSKRPERQLIKMVGFTLETSVPFFQTHLP